MTTRRKRKEGSVHLVQKRGWTVAFKGLDGRRLSRKSPVQSKEGAEKFLRHLLKARDADRLKPGRCPTVKEFVDVFLVAAEARAAKPRTIEAYRERLTVHVVPAFGRMRLNEVTSQHVQKLQGSKLKAGLSVWTVVAIHQVLNGLFKLAKRRRLVEYNVVEDVDQPKRPARFSARPLSVAEAQCLLRSIQGHHHAPLWTFLLGTGCRFGEAVGLAWADVDLDSGVATIRQQVTRERHAGRVTHRLASLKSDAGYRDVYLAPWVISALRIQQARVADMKVSAGRNWSDLGMVFPNRHGDLLAENHVNVTWRRALEKLTLPNGRAFPKIRMHDLRHTKATLMLDEGEDIVVVQHTLGHARSSITANHYIGRVGKALRRAADRYGELLDTDQDG